jgi:hypothetical protein
MLQRQDGPFVFDTTRSPGGYDTVAGRRMEGERQ